MTSDDRIAALASVRAFAALPEPAVSALAQRMTRMQVPAGVSVVREGEAGDAFYVIAGGSALAQARGVPLASLGQGDVFGEVALLTPEAVRTATVTARSELELLRLDAADFAALLDAQPALRLVLRQSAQQLLKFRFLRLGGPFSTLGDGGLAALVARIESRTLPAGETVLREGEWGDEAYCIARGKVEVLRAGERVAVIESGGLFGEAALLTGTQRSATVRTLEPTELLCVSRPSLLAAMTEDAGVARSCLMLLRSRERPRRVDGIELYEAATAEGGRFAVLKDSVRGRYYRLSEEGRFVWGLLDGSNDLKQVTLAFFSAFRRFAPDLVASLVASLAQAGFVRSHSLAADVPGAQLAGLAATQRVFAAVRRVLTWQRSISGCDRWIGSVYRHGIHMLFRPAARRLQDAVVAGGLFAFVAASAGPLRALQQLGAAAVWWWVVPLLLLAFLAHEAAHAFAVKHAGREVDRVGFGWHWVGPILFVDTTDMWVAASRERFAVSAAGLYVNLVLAGLAALLAAGVKDDLQLGLWLFGALSYASVLMNLNPVLELDGYHMLSDWVDRPNLRADAVRWLRHVLHGHRGARSAGVEAAYCAVSLLYLVGVAAAAWALLAWA